jgi:hypothetical protein
MMQRIFDIIGLMATQQLDLETHNRMYQNLKELVADLPVEDRDEIAWRSRETYMMVLDVTGSNPDSADRHEERMLEMFPPRGIESEVT